MDNKKAEFGPKKFEGMSQYRPPLNFELVGKTFELVMDNGYDYVLEFSNRKILKYGKKDGKSEAYAYDCLKADDDTYFVNFEVTGAKPRAGLTFILDLEQSLVTANYCTVGENPRYPKLPKTNIVFGAIRKEDGSVPTIRHGYTADLVGHSICWRYGTLAVIHVYSSERYYRLTMPEDMLEILREKDPVAYENLQNKDENYLYEEPCDYIKIKDGIYVFSMTEAMANRDRNEGNNLFFLMNLNRMYDVGRSFGHNEKEEGENYTYGAFGAYCETPALHERKSTEFIR